MKGSNGFFLRSPEATANCQTSYGNKAFASGKWVSILQFLSVFTPLFSSKGPTKTQAHISDDASRTKSVFERIITWFTHSYCTLWSPLLQQLLIHLQQLQHHNSTAWGRKKHRDWISMSATTFPLPPQGADLQMRWWTLKINNVHVICPKPDLCFINFWSYSLGTLTAIVVLSYLSTHIFSICIYIYIYLYILYMYNI